MQILSGSRKEAPRLLDCLSSVGMRLQVKMHFVASEFRAKVAASFKYVSHFK